MNFLNISGTAQDVTHVEVVLHSVQLYYLCSISPWEWMPEDAVCLCELCVGAEQACRPVSWNWAKLTGSLKDWVEIPSETQTVRDFANHQSSQFAWKKTSLQAAVRLRFAKLVLDRQKALCCEVIHLTWGRKFQLMFPYCKLSIVVSVSVPCVGMCQNAHAYTSPTCLLFKATFFSIHVRNIITTWFLTDLPLHGWTPDT